MPSLTFKGKALVQNFHLVVPYHELKLVKSKSLTPKPSLHDNLVVHGDNLKALKSLLPYYHGKVKCIYIDPPYNTGNENWVYNDNVSSPMIQEWLGKVVDREDLTRHDKWLCMIWPRLRALRDFLTDDGVLLASIDDNEVHHLRMAMDEVFGEENFLAQLTWEKGRKNDAKLFSTGHEYMLVYARSMARIRESAQSGEKRGPELKNSGTNTSRCAGCTETTTQPLRTTCGSGLRTCQNSTQPRLSLGSGTSTNSGRGGTGTSRGREEADPDTTSYTREHTSGARFPTEGGFTPPPKKCGG